MVGKAHPCILKTVVLKSVTVLILPRDAGVNGEGESVPTLRSLNLLRRLGPFPNALF